MGLLTFVADLVRLPARKLRGLPGMGWVQNGNRSVQNAESLRYISRETGEVVTRIPRFQSVPGTAFVWAVTGAWVFGLLVVAEILASPITRQL